MTRCYKVITLIELHSLSKSRTDHDHVHEDGKPFWRHFREQFAYTRSVIGEVDPDSTDYWDRLQSLASGFSLISMGQPLLELAVWLPVL